jgi:hypothetical protein
MGLGRGGMTGGVDIGKAWMVSNRARILFHALVV